MTEKAKNFIYFIKVISLYLIFVLVLASISYYIVISVKADYKDVMMSASVEKSDYYKCVEKCELEHINN